MIDKPGFYELSAVEYHKDPAPAPSLSNSVAQILLAQSPQHAFHCHPRLNPNRDGENESRRLDLGSVAHELLLGKGRGVQVIDADSFKTKAAREARDTARAAGKTPVLPQDYERALVMVERAREAIAKCKEVGRMFLAPAARFEPVLIWREGDCWARAMLDCTDCSTVLDYKTVTNASADYVARHIYNMGYHIQRSWYLRGLDALDPSGIGRRRFIFMCQEIDPPHAVSFHELDGTGATMGERACDQAVSIWQECMRQNRWPSYDLGIHRAVMPGWLESSILAREIEEDERRRDRPENIVMAG